MKRLVLALVFAFATTCIASHRSRSSASLRVSPIWQAKKERPATPTRGSYIQPAVNLGATTLFGELGNTRVRYHDRTGVTFGSNKVQNNLATQHKSGVPPLSRVPYPCAASSRMGGFPRAQRVRHRAPAQSEGNSER